jgi:uncharacterized protein (TIGR02452 family)
LDLRPEHAESLARSAVESIELGYYLTDRGQVDWSQQVATARRSKVSIPPDAELPKAGTVNESDPVSVTRVQVTNQTTLGAAKRLVDEGLRPLALNFANGFETGGGFLRGATAQEETLCRSSALYATLLDDPMYNFHRDGRHLESSSWAILSPDVPVFRNDAGMELDQPWSLSFITCAAPYAPEVGQPRSSQLLRERIDRVMAIAHSYDYRTLVLGAWGCGAFGNDATKTAEDFRETLEHEFAGVFTDVVFAITDWSEERRFLGPFRAVFAAP